MLAGGKPDIFADLSACSFCEEDVKVPKAKKCKVVEEDFWDDEDTVTKDTEVVDEEDFWDDEGQDTDDVLADTDIEEAPETDEEDLNTPPATKYEANGDGLVTYERERLANIARREAYMKTLGLDRAKDVTLVLDTHPTHDDTCYVSASLEKLLTLDLKHVPSLYMTEKWELKTKDGTQDVANGLDHTLYPNEDLPVDTDPDV
ncbi:hypothetical protein CYMTET_46495 [Cymbomonas tetramitiformis]|uniref:Uncharacterized protein n=1 Tax=Cymbomonas tetramitiformis TaxID=36881 RepID=A0AAE0BW54_9CHLO|nr:hypothetical protein CYMTET_46495 [Cymbomonas tetramitiformis]